MNQMVPSAQRLLVQGVVASTMQLVRGVRDGREAPAVRRLMLERRRMLAELALDAPVAGQDGSLWALQAAVVESDRTLEALLG
jgi:hypothetical protein